ncbi:MAG: transglycosylase SLT domain-containing protein [Nocardioidaceae bacterium]
MSIADVTARIQQIQGQLATLGGPSTAATTSTSGASFQSSLAAADAAAGATVDPAAGPAAGTDALAGGSTGQAVVAAARQYLGTPYVWGGTDPKKGLDCSGLVQLVYKQFGIDLPRVSYEQAQAGRPVASLAQAQPGDILAFGDPVHHVAIYIGDNKMIEAPRPGLDVRVSDVYETPSAIRRVLPDPGTAAVARSVQGSGSLPAGTPYGATFQQAAARYGVPASLLAAVAHQESGYRADAVSPAGARGLMQLMPSTAASLGVNPLDPGQAVDGAARLLRDLMGEFGSTDLALAAYNAGPGAVHRYHGMPPYPETRRYVPAVLAYQSLLEAS